MSACPGLTGNMSESEIVIKRLTIFYFLDILNKKVILLTPQVATIASILDLRAQKDFNLCGFHQNESQHD